MVTTNEVMTIAEAAKEWGMDDSIIRHAIHNNRFNSGEIRRSANTWLLTRTSMLRLYGHCEDNILVYTIGYEGMTIKSFIDSLYNNKIDHIFDIREIPNSRKPGFSNNKLENVLLNSNINYTHFKELGSPKNIREKLLSDHDYVSFFISYKQYLFTQKETLDILNTAIYHNKNRRFCLLCFEKNPNMCHRSIVAQEIANLINGRVQIVNI